MIIVPTLYDVALSEITDPWRTVSAGTSAQLFQLFKDHPLFNWKDANNGCEGRADAVCVLLDAWGIPNYKAWIFGGAYLKGHIGALKQNWKYHVAAVLAVQEQQNIVHYVIDPATADTLQTVEKWAAGITQLPHSYYCIRKADWYIFPGKDISNALWHERNKQNRKWMIQCLAGINGLTPTGKARLCFNKNRLKNISAAFEKTKQEKPALM